jgi:hypothetical protein
MLYRDSPPLTIGDEKIDWLAKKKAEFEARLRFFESLAIPSRLESDPPSILL